MIFFFFSEDCVLRDKYYVSLKKSINKFHKMSYVLDYAEMLFGSLSIIIMDYHYVEFIVLVVLSDKFVLVAFDSMAICDTSCNH